MTNPYYKILLFRGVCLNDWTDVFYTVKFNKTNNMPYFVGDTGTTIEYNEDKLQWIMKTILDPELVGTANASIEFVGTGAQLWHFNKGE